MQRCACVTHGGWWGYPVRYDPDIQVWIHATQF